MRGEKNGGIGNRGGEVLHALGGGFGKIRIAEFGDPGGGSVQGLIESREELRFFGKKAASSMEALLLPNRVSSSNPNATVGSQAETMLRVELVRCPICPGCMISGFCRAEEHIRIGKILEDHTDHALGLQDIF